jgi:hypothetical protein
VPAIVSPFTSFGSGVVADAWVEVGRVTSVSGGALTISGLDLSTYLVVRLFINGVTVTTDDSSVSLQFIIAGSTRLGRLPLGQREGRHQRGRRRRDRQLRPLHRAHQRHGGAEGGERLHRKPRRGGDLLPARLPVEAGSYRSAYANPAGNMMTMFAGGQLDDTGA